MIKNFKTYFVFVLSILAARTRSMILDLDFFEPYLIEIDLTPIGLKKKKISKNGSLMFVETGEKAITEDQFQLMIPLVIEIFKRQQVDLNKLMYIYIEDVSKLTHWPLALLQLNPKCILNLGHKDLSKGLTIEDLQKIENDTK